MITPQVYDKPDYTKVRGWLLAFGIYAGYEFMSGAASLLLPSDTSHDLTQRLPVAAAKVYAVSGYLGYVMLLVHLAQCVAIFQRLRIGRTLSLVANGLVMLHGLIWLPFVGALVEASKPASLSGRIHPATLVILAYVAVFIALTFAVLAFLYFLRSERVKQTLVN